MWDGEEGPSRSGPEWDCMGARKVLAWSERSALGRAHDGQQLIRSERKLSLPPLINQPRVGSNPSGGLLRGDV